MDHRDMEGRRGLESFRWQPTQDEPSSPRWRDPCGWRVSILHEGWGLRGLQGQFQKDLPLPQLSCRKGPAGPPPHETPAFCSIITEKVNPKSEMGWEKADISLPLPLQAPQPGPSLCLEKKRKWNIKQVWELNWAFNNQIHSQEKLAKYPKRC